MKNYVVIHQPDFIPYLGFFHRFLLADVYIALDHVQFVNGTSRAWTHRDEIKTVKGRRWISIPVQKAVRGTPINKIKIVEDQTWRGDHLNLLFENYRSAAYYREIMPSLERLYGEPFTDLATFNLCSIKMLAELLDVKRPILLSSNYDPSGRKNEMLVGLLQMIRATHYVSGVGAKDYFDPEPFLEAGIDVVWQDFQHPVYPQVHGPFEPYLSSIDLLFNCGIERSRKILRGEV